MLQIMFSVSFSLNELQFSISLITRFSFSSAVSLVFVFGQQHVCKFIYWK